MLTNVD